RAPWTPEACRRMAAIVNGKLCIVLCIAGPPYGSAARCPGRPAWRTPSVAIMPRPIDRVGGMLPGPGRRLAALTGELTLRPSVQSTDVLSLQDEPASTGRSPPLREDVWRSAVLAWLAGGHTVGHRRPAAGRTATCRARGGQGGGAWPRYRPRASRHLLR